ncbi:hypothetical protein [Ammoniphilus sp. 3BR4]|uniref:hypothetical protein n=1 Tax=Ammoniphilus sp. 3BR4 TaxID=3158265 RepID=UPI003465A6B6
MKKLLNLMLLITFFTISILYHSPEVKATSCAPHDVKESIEQDDAIFQGKVIGTKPLVDHGVSYLLVLFEVEQSWKGVNQTQVVVQTQGLGVKKLDFMKGRSYLVFAYKWKTPQLQTNDCKGTKPLSEAANDLSALGNGKQPTEHVDLTSEFPIRVRDFLLPWGIFGIIAIIVVGVGAVSIYRKRKF